MTKLERLQPIADEFAKSAHYSKYRIWRKTGVWPTTKLLNQLADKNNTVYVRYTGRIERNDRMDQSTYLMLRVRKLVQRVLVWFAIAAILADVVVRIIEVNFMRNLFGIDGVVLATIALFFAIPSSPPRFAPKQVYGSSKNLKTNRKK